MKNLHETAKKLLPRVLLLAALLALICATAMAALSYPFNTVTTEKVNLRKKASSTSVVLTRVPAGATITVEGQSGSFYKVVYNGKSGYIMKTYVDVSDEARVTPTPIPVETVSAYPYDTVTLDKVNLRKSNSQNSAILREIPKGATLSVEKIIGSYAKVTYKGTDGYVKKDYIMVKKVVKPTPTPTPVPTLSPAEDVAGYEVLQRGSEGAAVKALQQALVELGFLSGTADGKFGAATESAVVALQAANDYPTTGVVDANLQAHLYSGKPKNVSGKKQEITVVAPVEGVTIRLKDTGDQVITIQTRLAELGFYTGDISGTYDKATQTAVKAFQKKNNLTADGVCGKDTQQLLLGGSGLSAAATPTPEPTPAPTAVPTYERPSSTVKKGSEGADAKMVQRRLKELGYYKGATDGNFGNVSVKALKAFQTNHGLEADGVAGQGTYNLLFSWQALSAKATPTPVPTPEPTPAPTPVAQELTKENCTTVRLGSSGDAVLSVQKRLTELGYYNAAMDSVCKADDVAAIKAFQRKNNLTADGVAGFNTQVKLFSPAATTENGAMAGGTVDSFTTLRKGANGASVTQLQQRLIELGYLTGEADGDYGTNTASAVYTFQKQNKLVRDGVAGPATLAKVYSATAVKAAAPTATPAPTVQAVTSLKKGDKSDAVKEMQQRLIALGYLKGSADGQFGSATYQALKAFQKNNRLSADGIAGSNTLTVLGSTSAIKAGSSSTTSSKTPASTVSVPKASQVKYANWYTTVKAICRKYPYATVYDPATGISWQIHMFSLGAHADSEPLTANDTAKMLRAFGGNTWNPKPLWVIFGDGSVYLCTSHSMEHGTQHRTDNNFNGHVCFHFPRTEEQVVAIGTYATSHQRAVDKAWAELNR